MNTFSKTVIWLLVLVVIGAGIYWFAARDANAPEQEPESAAPSDPWAGLQYVTAVDWPPQVQIVPGPFSCTEAGEETARAGRTESRAIGGRTYCVTTVAEGAAGSVYTQYAYATEMESGEVVIYTWSSRAVQCANYDEPQMSACQAEQDSFDPDRVMAEFVATI